MVWGMVASELRIGNYILTDKNMFCEIKEISHIGTILVSQLDFWKDDTLFGFTIQQLKPIPLSEEILLKCGFIDMWLDIESEFSELSIGWRNSCLHVAINCEVKSLFEHSYLHQLQNLYFALTGKELEIEL